MPAAQMGSATAKSSGGSSDPNVLSLKEANRIRIIEPVTYKWRQHFIQSEQDPEQGRSVVCPKGPDGRDSPPCPLCMKPVDENGKQRFSISRRFATNVWDYESNSVKVLIAGPQVFEEFDAIAAVGIDPTSSDFIIHKMGKGISTSYKVVRGDPTPLPTQVTPDMMHDLSKYDTPDSTERIFEKLEEMGIDYDSLETPSYTLEEAEAFQMPYGKSKGLTIEQIVANDTDYALYMHRMKKEQGSYGDPVFIALQVVLEDRGEVESLDEVQTAPPAPASSNAAPAPEAASTPAVASEGPPVASGMVTLVGPDGNEVEVPAATADALRQAGYTDPAPEPVAEPVTPGMAKLVGPDGQTVEVPEATKAALLAAGYTEVGAAVPAPAFQLPGDEELVDLKLNVIPLPVPTPFKDAKRIVSEGQGHFVDEQLAAAVAADAEDDKTVQQEVATAAATDPTPAGTVDLDPGLTEDAEGGFTHPALDGGNKVYKTKGGVTQALNKLRKAQPEAATAAPANGGAAPSAPATGLEAKLEEAKNLLRDMPEYQSDFNKLLDLFQEVAGKRQITEFTEPELDKLISRMKAEQATA